ncbi:hypothetical protein BT96DRAFT_944187 [Gymnopus androsaceus JB14]|uniref:Uncharacterized protein n=1 Tax=Gymnopus androsaceus JB14 TaxID=1447944 RepID=A0A6A4H7C8_9AGAR|nr:hypothetical protein BT96DRAFT_944187 [Gymnopus androsaceus JB14]
MALCENEYVSEIDQERKPRQTRYSKTYVVKRSTQALLHPNPPHQLPLLLIGVDGYAARLKNASQISVSVPVSGGISYHYELVVTKLQYVIGLASVVEFLSRKQRLGLQDIAEDSPVYFELTGRAGLAREVKGQPLLVTGVSFTKPPVPETSEAMADTLAKRLVKWMLEQPNVLRGLGFFKSPMIINLDQFPYETIEKESSVHFQLYDSTKCTPVKPS